MHYCGADFLPGFQSRGKNLVSALIDVDGQEVRAQGGNNSPDRFTRSRVLGLSDQCHWVANTNRGGLVSCVSRFQSAAVCGRVND